MSPTSEELYYSDRYVETTMDKLKRIVCPPFSLIIIIPKEKK